MKRIIDLNGEQINYISKKKKFKTKKKIFILIFYKIIYFFSIIL
jgi:hypothetical protein